MSLQCFNPRTVANNRLKRKIFPAANAQSWPTLEKRVLFYTKTSFIIFSPGSGFCTYFYFLFYFFVFFQSRCGQRHSCLVGCAQNLKELTNRVKFLWRKAGILFDRSFAAFSFKNFSLKILTRVAELGGYSRNFLQGGALSRKRLTYFRLAHWS